MSNARIAGRFRHALVVEDNAIIALQLDMVLDDLGIGQVTLAVDEQTALAALETLPVDVALVDFLLDRGNSARIIEALQARGTPFIIMTGLEGTPLMPGGAPSPLVLHKPFLPQELEAALERFC